MKIQIPHPPAREWHRWFAWHPVRIDGTRDFVWLETVERWFDTCDGECMDFHFRRPVNTTSAGAVRIEGPKLKIEGPK